MKKVIFVDFDDTICLHKTEVVKDKHIFYPIKEICDTIYKNSCLNKELYKYLIKQKAEGNEIILLTASCSKLFEIKKYWLEKNCPQLTFDDYISTSIDLNKTEIMLQYASFKGLKPKDLILIDDTNVERWTAEKMGIITYNPQLIMNK